MIYKLFLFFNIITFAQSTIKVEYSVVIGNNIEIQEVDALKAFYQSAIEGAIELKFNLFATKEENYFEVSKNLNNNNFSLSFGGYQGSIYSNNKEFYFKTHEERFLGTYVVKESNQHRNWELINNTKTIEGFLCYEARVIDIVTNDSGKFNYEVIAWYCPQISFSIGPNGYRGLPGLILELQRRNVVFGAKKIILNSEVTNEIIKPNLSKIKTQVEIQKMRADFINSLED